MAPVSDEIIEGFRQIRLANVSDALNTLGLVGGLQGIKPVCQPASMLGRAYTLRYVPCGQDQGTVGDFMEELSPGDVVVLDNSGRLDCTIWGYLLTVAAERNGVSGAVIEGACRDLSIIREAGFPVYARGVFMVTGKGKVMLESRQVPVAVGGVKVCPGDLIMGGESGVVCVPAGLAEKVLNKARRIKEAEDRAAAAVRRGKPLSLARAEVGYHWLQAVEDTEDRHRAASDARKGD